MGSRIQSTDRGCPVSYVSLEGQISAATRPLVVKNVRILDGQTLITANKVVVADGKIAAVGLNSPIPAGAEIVDGSGDTLLPGLIYSHVHPWTRDLLSRALMFGVTTELDMFMRWQEAEEWKREESESGDDIADFKTGGAIGPSCSGPY